MPWCFHSYYYWEKEHKERKQIPSAKVLLCASPKQQLDFEKYNVLKYLFTQVVQNFRQRQKKIFAF